MKKKVTVVILIILSFTIYYKRNLLDGYFEMICKQYKLNNRETYNVKIGETFEINLNQNYTTGYINCWLNQNQVKIVEKTKTEYKSDSDDKNRIGGGGILTYSFKGIKKGCDTIKFSNCPAMIERKKCEEYTFKNTEVDEMYIVNVTD
nr:protease inhibitor I42 family protein [uncultured Flavobacterium sp.]